MSLLACLAFRVRTFSVQCMWWFRLETCKVINSILPGNSQIILTQYAFKLRSPLCSPTKLQLANLKQLFVHKDDWMELINV